MVLLDVMYLSMNRNRSYASVTPNGGHHAGDRIAHKVLQSSFCWPTLFKDARKFVLSCDECQRIGNISRRQEIPMNCSLVTEPFDVRGFDYVGPFPTSNGYTHILVVVDYVTKYLLPIFTQQQKKKFFYDLRHCFWDDPHLYREGVHGIIRRCVPEHEQEQILQKCHSEAYGGHHTRDRTAYKVFQSGFYWPTLFKDARKFVLSCDEFQRIGNIGKHQEMPMNY